MEGDFVNLALALGIRLQAGQSARLVADLLGHAHISATLGIYARSTASQHQEAAAMLGEILTPRA